MKTFIGIICLLAGISNKIKILYFWHDFCNKYKQNQRNNEALCILHGNRNLPRTLKVLRNKKIQPLESLKHALKETEKEAFYV